MQVITIENKELQANIKIPDKTYKGSRFDRMGMIENVTLNGVHTFCGDESKIEGYGSGGRGFYNEFGIEDPIGYEEAKIGEMFPKIGVGLLTKDSDDAYDFFKTYKVKNSQYDIQKSEHSITIKSHLKQVNGYAVNYKKEISLDHNKMIVDYSLENIGSKKIETTEYCHNFITIDNHTIGPDYKINFSYPIQIEEKLGDFEVDEDAITWNKSPEEVLYTTFKNLPNNKLNYSEVIHSPSGVGVRETVNFKLHKVAVWGMPHVISPEAFIKLDLNPNETMTWRREYTFFC